ncbi:MAG: hypothetical protein AAF676_15130, partial [Pseudomonadota bacterium]
MNRLRSRRMRIRLAEAKAWPAGVEAEAVRLADLAGPGGTVELWAFESAPRRRAAEAKLAALKVTGRVRPAWKASREALAEALGPGWGPGDRAQVICPAAFGCSARFRRQRIKLPPEPRGMPEGGGADHLRPIARAPAGSQNLRQRFARGLPGGPH